MSFFRKMFGSKNRKNFKPGVETKQTVDGQKTEEKYSTYDGKKQHEAELWADLLKTPLLDYNQANAEKMNYNYVTYGDTDYNKLYKYFYIKQMLRRLLPNKRLEVGTHTRTVTLSTLVGKDSTSRTVQALEVLRKWCTNNNGGMTQKLVLRDFLDWLTKESYTIKSNVLRNVLSQLKPTDLLSLLKQKCKGAKLHDGNANWLESIVGEESFEIDPETLELK